jgi:hypothetical protein
MRESTIEKYFCQRVNKAGGLAFKWVSPGAIGVPDRIVFFPGMVFLVELKSSRGKLRPDQKYQREQLAKLDFDVVVINSKEQAKAWVEAQVEVLK